jgi:hypothetical protein
MRIGFRDFVAIGASAIVYILAMIGAWINIHSRGVIILLILATMIVCVAIIAAYNRIKFGVFFVNRLKK